MFGILDLLRRMGANLAAPPARTAADPIAARDPGPSPVGRLRPPGGLARP